MFNPPYVPTSDDEAGAAQHGAGIAGSWAGGADGMQVTDTLLRQVDVRVFFLSFFPSVSCDRTRTRTRSRRVPIGSTLSARTVLPGRSETKQCPQSSGIYVRGLRAAERGDVPNFVRGH